MSAATRGVAVAVDAEVVPRGEWELTALRGGARVEAEETDELLEPYGEWAGLASVYMLNAYKLGLVRLAA